MSLAVGTLASVSVEIKLLPEFEKKHPRSVVSGLLVEKQKMRFKTVKLNICIYTSLFLLGTPPLQALIQTVHATKKLSIFSDVMHAPRC